MRLGGRTWISFIVDARHRTQSVRLHLTLCQASPDNAMMGR